MDIEERAEKWLDREYPDGGDSCGPFAFDSSDMIAAYLAGSAQTQADYSHGNAV